MKKYLFGAVIISGVIIFAAVPIPQLTRRGTSAGGVALSDFNPAQFSTNGGVVSVLASETGPSYTNLTVISNAYFTTTYHTLINAVTALITNLNYVTGKGNVLNITNSIKLGDYYVYPILAGNGIFFF